MPKSLRLLLVSAALLCSLSGASRAVVSVYHWVRINVVGAEPSEILVSLGLNHYTRHGFTRDGFKKTDPDPTFPPGLTDVVPNDAAHLLLVRGTVSGVAKFRLRVLAAENQFAASSKWHITVGLLSATDDSLLVAAPIEEDVFPDVPTVVTLHDTDGRTHLYQIRLHVRPDAPVSIECRTGLPLAETRETRRVYAPSLVWTPQVACDASPEMPVLFDDRAADRSAAGGELRLSEEPSLSDYKVRVIVSPPVSALQPSPPAVTDQPAPPDPMTLAPAVPFGPPEERAQP